MKNYKKELFVLTIISTMSLMAAENKIIEVNTFDDDDGQNTSSCSLREAVKAISTHKNYGGCVANASSSIIQLKEGEYKLDSELRIDSAMTILGKAPEDYKRPNILTNTFPALGKTKTILNGQDKNRIINSSGINRAELFLKNLDLINGRSADAGGALLLGGATDLDNVSIYNSYAKVGGAIFLNNVNSNLTLNVGNIQKNQAENGSVLAMSCEDNLIYTPRIIKMTRMSVIENGMQNSQSMLAFCGQPAIEITASTIAKNIANSATGSIVQFSSNTPQGRVHLSPNASLNILSNTIVDNSAWSTYLYNQTGAKRLYSNILAYNNQGKSCRYADGDIKEVEFSNFELSYNALHLSDGIDQCEIPTKVLENQKKNIIDLSLVSIDSVLSKLQQPSEYTAFMPMYYPLDNNNKTDLVDVGTATCSQVDQRGIARIIAFDDNDQDNTCDLGATEVLRLSAGNIPNVNFSKIAALANYEFEYNQFKRLLEDPKTNPDFLPYYKIQKELFENSKTVVQNDPHYRTIFIDPFKYSLPDEQVLADGGRNVKHLTTDNYDVAVTVKGIGKINSQNQFEGQPDPDNYLKCEWNKDLKQILMYRLDDRITPAGDKEVCQYTLTLKGSNPIKSSSALIISEFVNIAPIAKDASYKIQYGTTEALPINLLEHMNDDGDGPITLLKNKPNKSAFYLNQEGQDLAIRIDKKPAPVVISAEREGPCPGIDSKMTCYGGKMTVKIKNTLDPFSYKFSYFVYDADGLVSNSATVVLNNSEMASNSIRQSGGGGALGWWSVLGLVGLLGYRKCQYRKY